MLLFNALKLCMTSLLTKECLIDADDMIAVSTEGAPLVMPSDPSIGGTQMVHGARSSRQVGYAYHTFAKRSGVPGHQSNRLSPTEPA